MIIHALQTGTPFIYEIFRIGYCIRSKCTSDKYFIYKWSTRLQNMVGRTASVITPLYFLLPGHVSISHVFKKVNYEILESFQSIFSIYT